MAASALLAALTASAGEIPWRTLPSGLAVGRLEARASPELPIEAWFVRLDPERHELRTLAPGRVEASPTASPRGAAGTAPPRVASVVGTETGALAVLNASYFDVNGRPLGLLVQDGVLLSKPNTKGWAWAALAEGKLILREASADVPAAASQAVQAGPLLVRNGKPLPLSSTRRARRSFLGADGAGRIVMGATNGALTLSELATMLARPESDGGAGLREAINLDGGSSSQLFVAGENPPLKVGGVPVPVFVAAFPRSPPR